MVTRPPYGRPGAGDPARRVVSPALVGRAAELDALVSVVSSAPAVVSLEGEAGVGKTRLVEELLAHEVAARRRVLLGKCYPIREPFPLGPLIDAVKGLGGELADLRLGPVAGALRELLPEVAGWLPAAPERLEDRAAARHRVFRAFTEVLLALGPAVLVLEDLHWADEQTADFLAYLLSQPRDDLAVMLTFRGEQVSAQVRALTAKLPAAVTRAHLQLAPLDVAGTGVLAAAILGLERVSDEFASYLWKRTSGLPFAVEEVLALVRARGLLVPGRDGGWSRRGLAELEVPVAIRDSTLERVARLSPAARLVTEAAAVLEAPVRLPVLLEVAGAGTPGVEEAIGSSLLAEQGELIGFRHVLAAQAVYESLSGPRRKTYHERAAAAYQAASPAPLGQIAHHLRRAGRLAQWVDVAEQAANQATDLGNEEEAVRLLEEILRDAPLDADRRGRVAVKLGWAALETLHTQDVAQLLTRVLEQELPRALEGELRFLLAAALNLAGGEIDHQRQLFIEAVAALGDRPDLRAWAMMSLGIATTTNVPLAEDLSWLHRSVRLAGELDDPMLEVFVLGKAAGIMLVAGDAAWRGHVDRVLEITGRAPAERRDAKAYFSIGMAACYAGDLATADLFLTRALAAPAARESRRHEISVRAGVALLEFSRGRWEGLDEEIEILLDELVDHPVVRIDAEIIAGGLALARGDLIDANKWLGSALGLAHSLAGHAMLPLATGWAARAALAQGDAGGALTQVTTVLDFAGTKGEWAPVSRVLPVFVETLAAAGEPDRARDVLDRASRELEGCDAPLAPPGLAHAEGLLAAVREGWEQGVSQLTRASELYRSMSYPYEAAQALEAAARCMFEAGDSRAEATLQAALAGYHRLGATWDAARAARTARRHGLMPAQRHGGGRRSYGAQLSPREREVAMLAAAGRSNREIGRELFLSPSTVEKHVRAAVRKLGARHRSDIGAHLATNIGADGEQTWR